MVTATPSGSSNESRIRRAAFALLAFVGVLIFGIVVSSVLGSLTYQRLEVVLPHRTDEAASSVGSFFQAVLPMTLFLAGLVGALFVWDPKIAPRTEAIGLIIALIVVASTWATGLDLGDQPYSVRALVVFELFGSSLAIGVLVLIFRWNVDRPTLIGFKAIAILLITGFLILLPLMLATNYFLVKFKVPFTLNVEGWAGALGGLFSFAVSIVGLGRKSPLGADKAGSG